MDLGRAGTNDRGSSPDLLTQSSAEMGRDPFVISRIETQTNGQQLRRFLRCHSDNAADEVASREVTFVYFFHREPKQFTGGELRIYDSRRENENYVPTANYRTIVPEQNNW